MPDTQATDMTTLRRQLDGWAREAGFQAVGVSDIELGEDEAHLKRWLDDGFHGDMDYMQRHGDKRTRPAKLVPGTLRVISARMDYLTDAATDSWSVIHDPELGFVSRYALGRDYHKLLRARLQRLATRITEEIGEFGYRVFTDSAPVLEKALARNAGLGWIGKHSNLLSRDAGSWFFLGELYTDLPLPIDTPVSSHCGDCRACIDCCPTAAIVAPYQVDARRCISYLTIELHGSIPSELRSAIGNRIYGCDDCQQVCPWNRFATPAAEVDFLPRHGLDEATLMALFAWSEDAFLARTEGSAIRRIGYIRWLRNIAVALGNAPPSEAIKAALRSRQHFEDAVVREHVGWALAQQNRAGADDVSAP